MIAKGLNKKGVSVMVGYVLLIVFAIIISAIVYQWLRSYVPTESLQCPSEVSILVKEASFNSSILRVTMKNSGTFNVAGYFIHGKNDSNQTIATIELYNYLDETRSSPASKFGSAVIFSVSGDNAFKPGDEVTHYFTIPDSVGDISYIRIVPTMFKEEDNRNRFVSCSESRVEGFVGEGGQFICEPDTCASLGKNCGTWGDGCGGTLNCGACPDGQNCNVTGQCELPAGEEPSCGDGIIQASIGEQCDDGNTNNEDGCSSACQIESGWICSGTPSNCNIIDNDCYNACISGGYGGWGQCVVSSQKCTGTAPFQANQYCGLGSRCCCQGTPAGDETPF